MQIVLASRSPQRQKLLEAMGLEFETSPAGIDESRHPGEEPAKYVERLAIAKALAGSGPGKVVIGADTAVVHRGSILGKPAHPAEARAMLLRLSGESHTVFTGLAVVSYEGDRPRIRSAVETSVVRFATVTHSEIDAYIATGEPLDKAGAYALQGIGGIFVESVEGSPSNVAGLPVHALARLLRISGVPVLGS
ncbi:MAG: Maf family protein [Acidimicrobiia bacterium]|nr:Maf family protein [Acidimicrobiia bacterium]